MLKSIDFKSLKFKVWGYFAFFAAIIMVMLWLLQIVFLNSFYKSMKITQIKKIGDSIVEEFGKSDFETLLFRQSFNNGFIAGIYDQNGDPINIENRMGVMNPPRTDPRSVITMINQLSKSKDGKVSYIIKDHRLNGKILIYGAKLPSSDDTPLYLYVNSQIEPVDSTAAVLQNQLLIVTIISLILSLAISLIIASRLSRPISRITQTAEKLAKGNYHVRFDLGNYTEVNQLATTLNYATQELAKTDELRRELIANVSHDLRTPLTMVKMYAELIRDVSGENAEKRNLHTQVIIEESNRLSTLTTDMLDLSKIQSGTAQINRSEFDLCEKAQAIIRRFNALSECKGFVFQFDCAGEAKVFADELKIEQAIYNLISNAVNFTGENKTITIRVKNINNLIRFEVTDTGIGIPKEKLNQIWERYYTADRTKKRNVIGTGLGLSIVKGILDAHNASYGVKSIVGRGSTFWFELDPPYDKNENEI
ncbi:MAG: HAMP domain-containing histidine kinase [Clostridia bacterium]|nr:HAMP domain-containing histidine kinase [Clostridia bacterium]